MDLIRVDGEKNLYRDPNSHAIINTDKNAYENYIEARNRKLSEREEIENLKTDIAELKDMMRLLIEKL